MEIERKLIEKVKKKIKKIFLLDLSVVIINSFDKFIVKEFDKA